MADTTTSVVNFKTPQEFINYYSNELKTELGVYDLQINKLGFIGFLLNMLGHTNYDAKQYYDSLFKEAFVATSQETENLYFHSSIYGYLPTFAVPSTAYGSVIFDFASLPDMLPGVIKREVIIGGDELVGFDDNGYKFSSDSTYKFVQTTDGYSVIVTTKDGKVTQLPSATSEISAPFQNFQQYETQTFNITLPNYDFGTYYPYSIEISSGHIADIKVLVTAKNSSTTEEYSVTYVKYFEESNSKTVFLRKLTSTKFIVEFGSGIRGIYIPSANVSITVTVTEGAKGNLNKSSVFSTSNYLTTINYYDATYSNKIETLPIQNASKYIKMSFQYSKDGTDPLSGDDLRYDIINHIQSYDMLLDETDFYNITQKYMNDFKFLFKKSNLTENIFYLCRSFRDKYQNVCQTINPTIQVIDSSLAVTNITTTIQDTGQLDSDTIDYKVVPSDGFNAATEVDVPSVDLTSRKTLVQYDFVFTNNSNVVVCDHEYGYDAFQVGDYIVPQGSPVSESIKVTEKNSTGTFTLTLEDVYVGDDYTGYAENYKRTGVLISWDAVTNANKYLVYKTVNNQSYYAETFTNSITDDGTNFVECTYPLDTELILNPKLMISEKEMISPFLYKWNSFMNWYDGYLLYDSFSVYFSETENTGLAEYNIPVLYFFIQYDYFNKKTYIDLKSHQDISDFVFDITISERSIYAQSFTNVDNTTWRFEYTDEDGLFWDQFHIELNAKKGSNQSFQAITGLINQLYDIKELLRILTYKMYVYSQPGTLDHIDEYILNIPMIEYNDYSDDQEYYLNKVKQFIIDNNVQGNRMISDSLQFRFLDTLNCTSYYLQNFTKQAYDSFDIVLPLKAQINIMANKQTVIDSNINLSDEKDDFLLKVADWLQKNHTGTEICFYNSQLVDLIHTGQPWIKSVSVVITDSNGTVIPSGLETLAEIDGLQNISNDKLGIVKFVPWFWYWDVDNISIKMIV